jgi:dipeptidase
VSAYAPDMSSYTPIYVKTEALSPHWTTGSMHVYDSNVAWWNFAVVGNYVARYYHFAVEGSVRELQLKIQTTFDHDCLEVEKEVMKLLKTDDDGDDDDEDGDDDQKTKKKIITLLTEFTVKKGDEVRMCAFLYIKYIIHLFICLLVVDIYLVIYLFLLYIIYYIYICIYIMLL